MYYHNHAKKIKMKFILNRLSTFILFVFLISTVFSCNITRVNRSGTTTNTAVAKKRNAIVGYAADQKGVKYRSGGKTPQGFDCSGFTAYVFRKVDVSLSATAALQSQQGKPVTLAKAKAGDLIFFGNNGLRGKVSHVGIVSKNNADGIFMIHSSSSKGVIETNVSRSTYWKPKILFVREIL